MGRRVVGASSGVWRLWSLLVVGGAMASCSTQTRAPSVLQVVVRTDMDVPKDIDALQFEVRLDGVSILRQHETLGPKGRTLPAIFSVERTPAMGARPLRFRVVAYGKGRPLVARDAISSIPEEGGILPIHLGFLCRGAASIKETGSHGEVESACGEEGTCSGGTCVAVTVTRPLVPTGTEVVQGSDSSCFDAEACFRGLPTVQLRKEGTWCGLRGRFGASDRINLAVALPEGGPGACGIGGRPECLVVLDQGGEGATAVVEPTKLTVPSALCEQGWDRIVVSQRCRAKTPSTSVCGEGTTVTQREPPVAPDAPSPEVDALQPLPSEGPSEVPGTPPVVPLPPAPEAPSVDGGVDSSQDASRGDGGDLDPSRWAGECAPSVPLSCGASVGSDGRTTVYVDGKASEGGSGGPGCPYRTVAEGLNAVQDLPIPPRVCVAEGVYDESGKLLSVRGLDVVGAGKEKTRLKVGAPYTPLQPGQVTTSLTAGVVVGDGPLPRRSMLKGMALVPSPSARWLGQSSLVVCDKGSFTTSLATGAPTNVAPTTVLSDIDLEGRVDPYVSVKHGVLVTTSGKVGEGGSGCYLELANARAAHFAEDGVYLLAAGMKGPMSEFAGVGLSVSKSTFENIVSSRWDYPGAGIRAWDNTMHLTIADSTFVGGEVGVEVTQHLDKSQANAYYAFPFTIGSSSFEGYTQSGLDLIGAVQLESLTNTRFEHITNTNGDAAALRLWVHWNQSQGQVQRVAAVVLARKNTIVNNDDGLRIEINPRPQDVVPVQVYGATMNFGTEQDPGGNVFYCNRPSVGINRFGFDVSSTAVFSRDAAMWLHGNAWESVPPTIGVAARSKTDRLFFQDVQRQRIDVAGGTEAAIINCDAARKPPR